MSSTETVIAEVVTVDDAIPTPFVAPVESTGLIIFPKTMALAWQFRTSALRPWVRLMEGASYQFGEQVTRHGGAAFQIGDTAAEVILPAGGPSTGEMYALWRPRVAVVAN